MRQIWIYRSLGGDPITGSEINAEVQKHHHKISGVPVLTGAGPLALRCLPVLTGAGPVALHCLPILTGAGPVAERWGVRGLTEMAFTSNPCEYGPVMLKGPFYH